jgi:lysophospholipase L1-like esterase
MTMSSDQSGSPFTCLVAFGDSITMGASATRPAYAWVARLGRLLSEFQDAPLRVVNVGVSGNLISPRSRAYDHPDSAKPSALERYRRDVVAHRPDLVTISYGLNDMRCGTPLDAFMADFDRLVQGIRQATLADIVIVGVYFTTGFQQHGDVWGHADLETTRVWNRRLQQYAAEHDLIFADIYGAQGEADWVVDKDGVHPNNLGHALIAHKVFEAIAVRRPALSLKPFRDALDYPRWADAIEMPLRNYDGIAPDPSGENQ